MAETTATLPASPAASPLGSAGGGGHTVRRLITYILLAIVVIIGATGLSGLLDRLLYAPQDLVNFDNYALAQNLAFTLIAVPLAALLWWLVWRDSAMSRDRHSVLWPLYVILMSTAAFLTFTFSLFMWAGLAISGMWPAPGLATAIVWALVWVWHYWMWRHPSKFPTRLRGVAPAIASAFSLFFATGGFVFALAAIINNAVNSFAVGTVSSGYDWQGVASPLVWAVGGSILWWWHWFRAGVRDQQTGFARVLLVFITGWVSFGLFATGVTLTLDLFLLVLTNPGEPIVYLLAPLGLSVATAAFGALVMVYHLRVLATHPVEVQKANGLVTSGVALAVVATGVGVTVNALLGALGTELVGFGFRNLLMGGISALVIGGALWWASWGPGRPSSLASTPTSGRRIYLVIIFGVSALVALITLLVIGFQLFMFAFDGATGESLLDRIRAALGLFVATLLVAAYHFALWRQDRTTAVVHERPHTIERVTLVTSTDGAALVGAIRDATGARVSVMRRAEVVADEPDAAALVAALEGVTAAQVLLVAGAKGKTEVIALAE